MKRIGIVPSADWMKTNSIYDDKYHFTNSYIQRMVRAGTLPVGVLPLDGRIGTPILDECDAFLIQGGSGIYGYHIDVMDHAVKNGKKVLGICLGMQTVHTYFAVCQEAREAGFTGSVTEFYLKRKSEIGTYLKPVADHRAPSMPRDNVDSTKHKVLLTPGSHIARLLGATEIMGASVHSFCVPSPAEGETVTGYAEDGTIEAVEAGETVIGTQFHPDVDDKLFELFAWLAE